MSVRLPTVLGAIALSVVLAATGLGAAGGTAAAEDGAGTRAAANAGTAALTNLDHLDFLHDRVGPEATRRHTTYRLAAEPEMGVVWTYADRREGGSYERIGGGSYDATTDTWSQGAFNADDLTRAAVVYLRHWEHFGDAHSRDRAYHLLRAVTYLQTASGPNRGNVVLWMQPDGSLNRSAEPKELPDPSDSGPSYWLARTVWALGEGYAAFDGVDPAFAAFLRDRLALAVGALERQTLARYGEWDVADGRRVPAWLVVDGADASAEAVLGLTAYARAAAPGDRLHRRVTRAAGRLAEGIAAMSAGDLRRWPYGAALPWTHSRSLWHAWASQMPSALAAASEALGRPRMLRPAVRDVGTFTPYLLTTTGAVNGLLPSPSDRTQIAYGVDSRLQSLLAVGETTRAPGLRSLAAVAGSWYFGANPAGEAMYDPDTGRTFDGINGDGQVNHNSGAESTIHGLLSMLALDARPRLRGTARSLTSLRSQRGLTVVEAEEARTSGAAEVVSPEAAWTGESLWSGDYLRLHPGSAGRWTVPTARRPRLVAPVVHLREARSPAAASWSADGRRLGRTRSGGVGEQGVTEAPGALLPRTLRHRLPAGATELRTRHRGDGGSGTVDVDAVLLRETVTRLVLGGDGSGAALLQSAAPRRTTAVVRLPGAGAATVRVFDASGRVRDVVTRRGARVEVPLRPGGFSIAAR